MTFHIITLFPQAFDSYLGESIIKRAIEDKKIKVKFYNPRDFVYPRRSQGRAIRVDKKPYGGGPGMVIEALPVICAVESAYSQILKNLRIKRGYSLIRENKRITRATVWNNKADVKIIWLVPGGKQFTNEMGATFAKHNGLIIICGRYEGIDARVKKIIKDTIGIRPEEISVGPFVLTGGELPAEIIIDAVSRQIPGVLGNYDSLEENRTASSDVYTRPEIFPYKGKKYRVPKILLTGHHKKIEEWKKARIRNPE